MSSFNLMSLAVAVSLLGWSIIYLCTKADDKSGSEDGKLLKLPLIADIHKSPITKPLANWDAWTREKGDVVRTKLMGIIPVVVLNTSEAATELFSRRSQWYSNRPPSVTMDMITASDPGQCRFTLMHDYDAYLKLHHRLLSPSFGALSAARYMPLMELESNQLLHDLAKIVQEMPDTGYIVRSSAVYSLLERTQSSVILALHYGKRVNSLEDPLFQRIFDMQTKVTYLAGNPGLPDVMPFLRHLPTAISPWKQSADRLYAEQTKLYLELLEHGKSSPVWNATKQAFETADKIAGSEVSELDLAFTLATSVQGGMETSPRQLEWLFVAALENPCFVSRAHKLLDAVVGRDRLPKFSDRSQLAYIDAIVHEMFRWRPVAPTTVPRRADKDDELNGVKIPKNAIIIANAWGIGRDSSVFDPALGDLHEFRPERWLRADDDPKADRLSGIRNELPLPVFGQGRRMCLGKRVAIDGMFMQVASLLWAFDIQPGDKNVDPWDMKVAGFMTEPKDFQFKLVPRGSWASEVISQSWNAVSGGLAEAVGAVDVHWQP